VHAHRREERVGDRPAGRHGEHGRDDHEAGVVVDAGQHLALPAVGQEDPADQVELPQVHRRFPLPPLVLAAMLLLLRHDQTVAFQNPVHRGPRRRRRTGPAEFERDPPGTPPRMHPPHLTHHGLDLGRDPGRAGLRPP
jgi:hypothetical protein